MRMIASRVKNKDDKEVLIVVMIALSVELMVISIFIIETYI